MARKHKLIRSARYYRNNPLDSTEMIAYGLAGVAVLGVGGFLLYRYYNPSTPTAAAPGTAPQYAQPGQFGGSNPAPYGYDANGNPITASQIATQADYAATGNIPPPPPPPPAAG